MTVPKLKTMLSVSCPFFFLFSFRLGVCLRTWVFLVVSCCCCCPISPFPSLSLVSLLLLLRALEIVTVCGASKVYLYVCEQPL